MRKLPFKGWDRFLKPENLRPARKAIHDTIDEQICDLLSEIAALVGLEEYDEEITGHRDW